MADQTTASSAIPIKVLIVDTNGNPVPGGAFSAVTIANGGDFAEGSVGDVAWTSGDGTVISLLKKIASAGGSAVTIADGADTVEGTLADAAVTTDANGTVSGKLRGIVKLLAGTLTIQFTAAQHVIADSGTISTITNVVHVDDNAGSLTVDGTVTTTPPANASTNITQIAGAALSEGQKAMAASVPVVIASDQAAFPVTVTGSVTANAGTNLNTSALALSATQTDGTQKAITRGGAKGATAAADVTSTSQGADHNALDVADGGGSLTVDAANLDVALSTRLKPADTLTGVTTVTTVSTITNVVHVDDNAGSLTVDAPVGTPVFSRLSDGAAALIGQKAMAASLPVVVASDQTKFPVNISQTGTDNDVDIATWIGSAAPTVGSKTSANSLPVVIASDQAAIPVNGDVDHDAVNTLKNIQIAGNASPVDVPPTVVSATGDRVRAHLDRYGAVVIRRRKIRETYTAVFRLGEAAARLDQTFTHVANTNKQWATLHHTVAAGTKEVKLLSCVCWITSAITVAPQGILELRQISAAPATGNPAITPTPHRRGGTAAEAVALYLPTTAGTEANVNSPLGHHVFDEAVSVATVAMAHPQGYGRGGIVLFDGSLEDVEASSPALPVGTLDGWAVTTRLTGATVMRMTVVMKFTEEIP